MNNIDNDLIILDEKDNKELIEYLGTNEITEEELIYSFEKLLMEYNELQEDMNENYERKEFDPYLEYGLNENDFH